MLPTVNRFFAANDYPDAAPAHGRAYRPHGGGLMPNRSAQFTTETPFLPQPLAPDVLEDVVRPVTTLAEAEAQAARLSDYRQQIAAAIDTVELALNQNHANYVGGRRSWSYETSNEVKARVRILKRQRQHLQEAFGACNRWIKRWHHEHGNRREEGTADAHGRALAFVRAAEVLLDGATLRMLWELVDTAQATPNGVARAEEAAP